MIAPFWLADAKWHSEHLNPICRLAVNPHDYALSLLASARPIQWISKPRRWAPGEKSRCIVRRAFAGRWCFATICYVQIDASRRCRIL